MQKEKATANAQAPVLFSIEPSSNAPANNKLLHCLSNRPNRLGFSAKLFADYMGRSA